MKQALQIARDAELDVVEVSPNAAPPVCRVMDFGKFVYERAKKEREARKSQTKIEVKEIRLRPKTNEAHRGFKVDDARRWLLQGHKVRVTGLGIFQVKKRPARMGRNPATGEQIKIKASKKLAFRAAKEVKDAI